MSWRRARRALTMSRSTRSSSPTVHACSILHQDGRPRARDRARGVGLGRRRGLRRRDAPVPQEGGAVRRRARSPHPGDAAAARDACCDARRSASASAAWPSPSAPLPRSGACSDPAAAWPSSSSDSPGYPASARSTRGISGISCRSSAGSFRSTRARIRTCRRRLVPSPLPPSSRARSAPQDFHRSEPSRSPSASSISS